MQFLAGLADRELGPDAAAMLPEPAHATLHPMRRPPEDKLVGVALHLIAELFPRLPLEAVVLRQAGGLEIVRAHRLLLALFHCGDAWGSRTTRARAPRSASAVPSRWTARATWGFDR